MKREKIELHPTLKVKPLEDDENAVQLTEKMQVSVLEVKDINTANGSKTLAKVKDSEGKVYSVFINRTSLNNLVDGFGDEDKNWIGKLCDLEIEQCPEPFQKQKMIVFKPIK